MSDFKISACLVLRDEELLIARCLESLKDVVDEIIIVHDGPCLDRTLDICRQFNAKIFIRDFVGVAEPHRPFVYSQASGDWILQIDADEYLSLELRRNLRLLAEDEAVAAYEFVWPLWDGEKVVSSSWPFKRCFFRKDRWSFLGLPQFIGSVNGQVEINSFVLNHRPSYNNYKWYNFKKKWLPWARIQAEYYLKDFSEIQKFNYNINYWPRQIVVRKRIPWLVLPFDFILVFLRTLFSGAYRLGFLGFKIALMQGAYRAAVDYYLFKLK